MNPGIRLGKNGLETFNLHQNLITVYFLILIDVHSKNIHFILVKKTKSFAFASSPIDHVRLLERDYKLKIKDKDYLKHEL